MDVVRATRFSWVPGLLVAGCLQGCLQVVPDTPGPVQPGTGSSTGLTANSAGSGTSGGAVGGTAGGTSSGGSITAGTTGGGVCTYPSESAGGTLFPYFLLGVGWVDTSAAVDTAGALSPESTVLLQLHCSGARYALIDISAAWDLHSQTLAQNLPQYTTAWLAEGGLILTVLEQGPKDGAAATPSDLSSWASEFGTNYPLVNDPSESALSNLGVVAWPALYIVRLSDMVIVSSMLGASDAFLATYAELLAQ
jgi:hypothetical protein